ncbi:MAG: ddlB [Paucimonas sp.]|nr:ddlB [Paucimonas sp.]
MNEREAVVLPLVRKVAVVSGGWSHEANYSAATSVMAAVERLGLVAVHLDYRSPDFIHAVMDKSIDVVFPQTLGAYGEDGSLQGLLDYLGRRYVGSGPLASAACANKLACSRFVNSLDPDRRFIAPAGILVSRERRLSHDRIAERLGSPFVFKPLASGASFGLRLIDNAAQYNDCLDASLAEFDYMLAEQFCRGEEYSVGLLQAGQSMLPLPPLFVRGNVNGSMSDIDDKLRHDKGMRTIEAGLSRRLRAAASTLAEALGVCGMARMDVIVDDQGRINFIEMNTLPGLLPGLCLFPKMCGAAGVSYDSMVRMAIDSALQPKPMQMRKLDNPPPRPAMLDQLEPAQRCHSQAEAA